MTEINLMDKELVHVFRLFFEDMPVRFEVRNTSHGGGDFREAVLAEWETGERYVIKLADNDFTFAEKIEAWKRSAEEYVKLGYYCPVIIRSLNGDFPTVRYKGHSCAAYAEEYSKYRSAEEFYKNDPSNRSYMDDALIMTAKAAAAGFDFTDYPSGYCLFDTFCPSDATDEVLENALEWKKYAGTLPAEFQPQVQSIWQRWEDNRKKLEIIYAWLPTSVFQADLNPSNILLDGRGKFVGVFDFNLCGKDVLLNYLFRELYYYDVNDILLVLQKISEYYRFSDAEKEAAPLIYRCVAPLWFTRTDKLKKAGDDMSAVKKCLDETEELQTREIDFSSHMNISGLRNNTVTQSPSSHTGSSFPSSKR